MQQSDPEGVSKLRRGVLLLILDGLLIYIFEPVSLFFLLWLMINGKFPTTISLIYIFSMLALIVLILVMFLGPFLITFAAAGYLNDGFSSLLSRRWGLIGAAGAWLLAIIVFVSTPWGEEGIIHLVSLVVFPLEFLEILFVADVGFVLIGIGLFKVGSSYNNKLLKIGGIVTAIPITNFIGLIISYVALGEVERGP